MASSKVALAGTAGTAGLQMAHSSLLKMLFRSYLVRAHTDPRIATAKVNNNGINSSFYQQTILRRGTNVSRKYSNKKLFYCGRDKIISNQREEKKPLRAEIAFALLYNKKAALLMVPLTSAQML